MKKISIIAPCYNEELNVEMCAQELIKVFSESLPNYEYEHIFADNASTDRTLENLKKLAASDKRIKVISNSRNVGPSVIPQLVKGWEAGFLVT